MDPFFVVNAIHNYLFLCSLDYVYPLIVYFTKMDHILQKVVGTKIIYMIDGFSIYNKLYVHDNDEETNRFYNTMGYLHV